MNFAFRLRQEERQRGARGGRGFWRDQRHLVGDERHFRARREPWATLLGLDDMPVFMSWMHLLLAALEISTWLDEKADADESEYLLASHARARMDRVSRDLQTAGVDLPRRYPSDGPAYLPAFESATNTILATLGAASAPPAN